MATLGTFSPNQAPTCGAKGPAAITTCSAMMSAFAVRTLHSPPDRRSTPVTRLCRSTVAPSARAAAAIAWVAPEGSTWPSAKVRTAARIPSTL